MTDLRQSAYRKRALLVLALLSLGALGFAQAAAAHEAPVGASPFRLPLVPAFAQCTAPNDTHMDPFGSGSCSPPTPLSAVAKWGPSSIGFVRYVVCPIGSSATFCTGPGSSMPLPDVRMTGNITDVECAAVGVGCPAVGGPYDPNPNPTQYPTSSGTGSTAPTPPCFLSGSPCVASQDMTVANPIRATDLNNSGPGGADGTSRDGLFGIGIPVDCQSPNPAKSYGGADCGFNTSANALAPGSILSGKSQVWEIKQVFIRDAGPDGMTGTGDDTEFARTGFFNP